MLKLRKGLEALILVGAIFFAGILKADTDFEAGLVAIDRQDYASALESLKASAARGHTGALFNLGMMYDRGIGVEQNFSEAAKWYELAASNGHPNAQIVIGHMYEKGQGVQQSEEQALKWTRRAAEARIFEADDLSSNPFIQAAPPKPSDFEQTKRDADSGNALAQNRLGVWYARGAGVVKSETAAARYIRLAAEQGLANAQFNLGLLYFQGQGVKKNYESAAKWFGLSAEQGLPQAQHWLADLMSYGWGVMRDADGAVKLYKAAAHQSYVDSQLTLALKYESGAGVDQDLVRSYFWWYVLSEGTQDKGHKDDRDRIGAKLTTEERTDAQNMAVNCLISDFRKCNL
jgi:TPR repeat protein